MTANFRVLLGLDVWRVLFDIRDLSRDHKDLLEAIRKNKNAPTAIGEHTGKEEGLNNVLEEAGFPFRLVVGDGQGPRRYVHLAPVQKERRQGMPPRSVSKA